MENRLSTTKLPAAFQQHYDYYVKPKEAEAQQVHREVLKMFVKRLPLGLAAGLVLIPLNFIIPIIPFIGFIAVALWAALPVLGYRAYVTTYIYPEIFKFYGPEYTYDAFGNEALVKSLWPAKLYPTGSSPTASDYVCGVYEGVKIELLQCMFDSEASGKNGTVGRALVIALSVPKKFRGHTVIRRDRGRVANFISGLASAKQVHLEDPRFEKRYDIFSTDQQEARYLLTPSFMERLMALEDMMTAYNGRECRLRATFYEDRLAILLPCQRRWFAQSSVFRRVNFSRDSATLYRQMEVIFEIVDVLKLNEYTGL